MSLTALFFVGAFFAFAGLAFVRHPIFGLFAYMLAFYMGPDTAWWGESLPNLRWSLLSAIVTMAAVVVYPGSKDRVPWHRHASSRVLIVFTLWLWLQTPVALGPGYHLFFATLFTKYVVMFALVYAALDDSKRIRQFLVAHILGCFYWGYLAWQTHSGGRLETIGTGDVAGSAFASMHVSTALAFAGFFFLFFAKWERWISFLAIPFIVNSIILMQTRGAFVGLVGAAPMAMLLVPPSFRKRIFPYLGLGVVLVFIVADDEFWERMSTIKPADDTGMMEASAASRLDIAEANLRMFLDHPLGVGHRGNDLLSPQYMPSYLLTAKDGKAVRSAHNTVMAILVDHGVIGIVLIAMFHIQITRAILRLRRRHIDDVSVQALALVAALGTALVVYWINGQFANMAKAEIVIWIAAIVAVMEANQSGIERKTSGQSRVRRTNAGLSSRGSFSERLEQTVNDSSGLLAPVASGRTSSKR